MPKAKTVLVTVLFTDIVGSTKMADELGDRRWRVLLTRHNALVRRELRRFRGREVDTAGDGFFATFARPADAIRCATAAREALRELGVEIRAGVHVGECEVIGKKVGGMTVHIAARALAAAAPGEIIVTGTVRDLVPGAGLEFAERGTHELKGVPGSWHLLALSAIDGTPVPPVLDPTQAAQLRQEIKAPPLLERRAGRVAALAITVALVLVGTISFLVERAHGSRVPAPVDRLIRLDPETGKVLAQIPLGGNPGAVATGAGAVWVIDQRHDTVVRIDPVSDRVAATIKVGPKPSSVAVSGAAGQEAVWVANEGDNTVWKVDPSSNTVTAKLPAGVDHPVLVLVGEGRVWVASSLTDEVARLDPTTGSLDGSFPSCCTDSMAVGYGSFWTANLRQDARDLRVQSTAYQAQGPTCGIAVGEGVVWACSAGTLHDIDPASTTIRNEIAIGHQPVATVAGSDSVWVVGGDGDVVWVRTATGSVAGTIPIGSGITGLAVGYGGVWVAVDAP